MKQLFRDEIPADFTKELAGKRFVKIKTSPFGGQILAKGDDPNVVNDASTDAAGVLYRIDERK